jgi:hypothetical protein
MRKLPAFQFYTGDWMKDLALRACSYAARGLWIDMLCMMHEAPHRGFLETSQGKPYSAEQIARMTGGKSEEVEKLLAELFCDGVYSKTKSGAIFSRRMKRDEMARADARYRQQKHRNSQQDKAESNGDVTGESHGGEGDAVTAASHESSTSTSVSVTRLKNLKTFSSRKSRAVGGNGTVDSDPAPAYDAAHHGDSDATSPNQADTQAETFTLATATESALSQADTNSQDFPPRTTKLHLGIIGALFAHFCTVCDHNPARYTLTPQRKKKALLRLQEQIRITGSLALAVEDLKRAIANLAASDYHRTHGYLDWEAQIFRSREEFEKRLAWRPPQQEESHAYESIEEHNARVCRQANARVAERTIDATRKPPKDEDS